jgi:hypothetical protein
MTLNFDQLARAPRPVLLLFATVVSLSSCTQHDRRALVQLNLPPGYSFVGKPVLKGDTFVTVRMPQGWNIVHLERNKLPFVAIVQIEGGGEMYLTINPENTSIPVRGVEVR